MIETLTAFDSQLFIAIHTFVHCAFLDRFMMIFTDRFVWVPMYCAMAWFLWRSFGTKKTIICLIAVALTITLADQTCASLIRPMVERLRPANVSNPISKFVQIVDNYRGGRYGFPSCHAANTFALASLFVFITRNARISAFLYVWALLNCYSRIYLGVHYPGDLLVGAVLGSIIAFIVYYPLNYVAKLQIFPNDKNFYPTYIVGAVTVIAIILVTLIW